MNTDYNLQFIRGRLNGIQNALMYNMSMNAAKLPNDVVRFLDIDEEGKLWFSIQSPKYKQQAIEPVFPVRLFFYQKGIDYRIEASGTACIDNNSHYNTELSSASSIIFKLTVSYIEVEELSKHDWFYPIEKWYVRMIEKFRSYYHKKNQNVWVPGRN
ncbi:MAG TPA: hypothetical protein VF476_11825 [Chitinophagaceae bacterium]